MGSPCPRPGYSRDGGAMLDKIFSSRADTWSVKRASTARCRLVAPFLRSPAGLLSPSCSEESYHVSSAQWSATQPSFVDPSLAGASVKGWLRSRTSWIVWMPGRRGGRGGVWDRGSRTDSDSLAELRQSPFRREKGFGKRMDQIFSSPWKNSVRAGAAPASTMRSTCGLSTSAVTRPESIRPMPVMRPGRNSRASNNTST